MKHTLTTKIASYLIAFSLLAASFPVRSDIPYNKGTPILHKGRYYLQIANPGFESGSTNWEFIGDAYVTTEWRPPGLNAALMGYYPSKITQRNIKIATNAPNVISLFFRATHGSPRRTVYLTFITDGISIIHYNQGFNNYMAPVSYKPTYSFGTNGITFKVAGTNAYSNPYWTNGPMTIKTYDNVGVERHVQSVLTPFNYDYQTDAEEGIWGKYDFEFVTGGTSSTGRLEIEGDCTAFEFLVEQGVTTF